MNEQTRKILSFAFLAFIVGIVTFLIPQSIGLGGGGFDSSKVLSQYNFYIAGGIFLLLLVLAFIIELVIKKGDERYGDSIGFSSAGETPHLPFFKKFRGFKLFLLCVIIFSILFFISSLTQQKSFIGFKTLEHQFTPTAELLFSTLLVPGAENLGLALVIAAVLVGIRMIARKKNLTKANFVILASLGVILISGVYGLINHLLRYSGQDYNLIVVFIFWLMMGLVTMLTGSFIPAWVMHITNNLFFDMKTLFSRDNIIIGVAISLLVLIVMYFLLYGRKKKSKPVWEGS